MLEPGRLLNVRLDALRNGFLQRSLSVGTASRSHVRLARLSVDGAWADTHGGLTSGGVSLSRGVLGLDSPDARAADLAGLRARGDFWVGQLRVQRDQPLPRQWQLRLTFNGQMASHALDGSEKFYLGGPYGVMSAPVNDGGGEAGALLDARLMHALPWVHTGACRAPCCCRAARSGSAAPWPRRRAASTWPVPAWAWTTGTGRACAPAWTRCTRSAARSARTTATANGGHGSPSICKQDRGTG